MEDQRKVAIYSRKSKWSERGESTANQIELCKQYVSLHFGVMEIDDEYIFEDEGFSGGNLRRPRFKALMDYLKQNRISVVVCYKLDRISRNVADFSDMIEEFNQKNVAFVSISEHFDTSTPIGRAMMMIAIVFAQLERETIAERVRDNMHELAKTGRWLGGNTPLGYASYGVENVKIDGKTKRSYMLQEIPDESALVRTLFDKFAETNSLTKVETYLIQRGYKTKKGKDFSRFAIKNILSNPVYAAADRVIYDYFTKNNAKPFAEIEGFNGAHGVMAYNRTLQKRGKANKIKEMPEWIIAIGRHTAIISGLSWIKVQELLLQNRDKSFRKPRSNTALLPGLLRCGKCGEHMRPKQSKRTNADGKFVYDYVCTMKEKSRRQRCTAKNINGNLLDGAVCSEAVRLSAGGSRFQQLLERSKSNFIKNDAGFRDSLNALRKQQADIDSEIAGLVSVLARATGTAAQDHILSRIDELHVQGEKIKNNISELEKSLSTRELSADEFAIVLQALSSFAAAFGGMDIEQRRNALRFLIKRVIWDGKNVHIYFFGSDDGGEVELPL